MRLSYRQSVTIAIEESCVWNPRFVSSQFTYIAEENGGAEIPFDICLFEWLNFAREHMLELQFDAIKVLHGVAYHTKCKERTLRPRTHSSDAQFSPFQVFRDPFQVRSALHN